MKLMTTIIGSLAAIGTTAAWLPQVLKTWKTGRAEDFSRGYLAMFSAGVTGWLVYGILKRDAVIIAANAITLLLVLTIVFVKMRNPKLAVLSREDGEASPGDESRASTGDPSSSSAP